MQSVSMIMAVAVTVWPAALALRLPVKDFETDFPDPWGVVPLRLRLRSNANEMEVIEKFETQGSFETKKKHQKCNVYDGAWRPAAPQKFNCPKALRHISKYTNHNWWKFSLSPDNVHPLSLSFEWAPRNCKLESFDASAFSRALAGRKLYLIGDSITMTMWQTLACQLSDEIDFEATKRAETEMWLSGAVVPPCDSKEQKRKERYCLPKWRNLWCIFPTENSYCFKPGVPPEGDEQHPGLFKLRSGGQVELLFSDFLVNRSGDIYMDPYMDWDSKNDMNRLQVAWAKRIIESSTPQDVIVLNTGAHHANTNTFMTAIDQVFRFLKEKFKGKIIWRDFYPGMTPCLKAFEGPLQMAPATEDKYNWLLSEDFNKYAERAAMRLRMDVHFMKISHVMSLRCDRFDELHFGVPGAPVEWNRLLYAALGQG